MRTDETPALTRLLDAMEGTPMDWTLRGGQRLLYCDTCADPIYANNPVHILWTDRIVWPEELADEYDDVWDEGLVIGGFRLQDVSHARCTVGLPYPCEGYSEMLVEATYDTDFKLSRPELLTISTRTKGIPWDPIKTFNAIDTVLNGMHGSFAQYMRDNDIEYSPHELIMTWLVSGIDPRNILDRETGDIIVGQNAHAIRESLKEGVMEVLEDWQDELPPFIRFQGENRGDPEGAISDPDVTPEDIDKEQDNE